jgi:hypothetical protein
MHRRLGFVHTFHAHAKYAKRVGSLFPNNTLTGETAFSENDSPPLSLRQGWKEWKAAMHRRTPRNQSLPLFHIRS